MQKIEKILILSGYPLDLYSFTPNCSQTLCGRTSKTSREWKI